MKKITQLVWAIALYLFFCAHASHAATLQPDTLKAWHRCTQLAQARANARLLAPVGFLWLDEDPRRPLRLREGQLEIAPIQEHECNHVPNGLVHDWIGAMFIPRVSLDQVLSLLTDYGRYTAVYNPEVVDAKLLTHTGDWDEFSMKLVNKVLFISAGVDMQVRSRMVRLDDHRAYGASYTTRVQDVRNYGRPDESELAPDTGDGFIWRLYATTRCAERDGGVYLEMETIALTRDIPGSMKFWLTPLVKKLSRNALAISLQKTRDAFGLPVEIASQPSKGVRAAGGMETVHVKSAFQRR